MLQLDRKEFFRQQELTKKQAAEEAESSRYPYRPTLLSKGVCDCCGKLKCNYKQQLFMDGIRENTFQKHGDINGYDETVLRLRKGLMNKYSREMLYRRMGDANYEHIKKQEVERHQPDYYDKNYFDENPIIINANINLGSGKTIVVPIRKNDDIPAMAVNICSIHNLSQSSIEYMVTVLEEYKATAERGQPDFHVWQDSRMLKSFSKLLNN